MNGSQNRRVFLGLIALAAIVIGMQAFATWNTTRKADAILDEIRTYEGQVLSEEKTRNEVAALRIQNEITSFYWHSLLTSLIPTATAFVALLGGWLGLRRYLDTRAKEHLDREIERLDRGASDLNDVLQALAAAEPRGRIVGLVGLQHFFQRDKAPHHLRALSALAAAARLESDPEVLRALRICAEQAFANVRPELLREVSWQGVQLAGLDAAGRDLAGLDLRDANLEDAVLAGADLRSATMTNCRLNGGDLNKADLRGARLGYVDFAGADLRGADFDPETVPWDLVSNWRRAKLDEALRQTLIARFGPEPGGIRVLMLMWEVSPLVAGGTWTACYHLVRNLRRQGADITVVVPWHEDAMLPNPFGSEVKVVAMGITLPRTPVAPYAAGPYGYGPYGYGGGAWWSPYGRATPQHAWWSPYGGAGPQAWASPYGGPGYGGFGDPRHFEGGEPDPRIQKALLYRSGAALVRLTEQFSRHVARWLPEQDFDLIHAHDWVTFPAAEAAARKNGRPWLAHFHSLEIDRREARPDPVIQRIEAAAVASAAGYVVPSASTAARLNSAYGAAEDRITVLPNSLSPEEIPAADMGAFETKQVVFLGRFSPQKGPDLFEAVAREVRYHRPDITFLAFGEGEEVGRLHACYDVTVRDKLEWNVRGAAFRGASALLVPSRHEPFGMVILEGMQHRVPVLYSQNAGAAEFLKSGIPIDPSDIEAVAAKLIALLDDWSQWESTVEAQAEEIAAYPERGVEAKLIAAWGRSSGVREFDDRT